MMNGHHFAHKARLLTWFLEQSGQNERQMELLFLPAKMLNFMLFQGEKHEGNVRGGNFLIRNGKNMKIIREFQGRFSK
jgi:hypothetical protein